MSEDLHRRAEQLKIDSMGGKISTSDLQWLETHLEACSPCAQRARAIEVAVQALRSVSVRVDPALVRSTQMKVYARAEELNRPRARRLLLWTSCATSWVWMAACALFLWHGFERLASQLGIPNWLWQAGFGLWWALPPLIVALALTFQPPARTGEGVLKAAEH